MPTQIKVPTPEECLESGKATLLKDIVAGLKRYAKFSFDQTLYAPAIVSDALAAFEEGDWRVQKSGNSSVIAIVPK